MVDMTWGGWDAMEDVANANGFPYVRIDASNHQFIKVSIYSKTSFLLIIIEVDNSYPNCFKTYHII